MTLPLLETRQMNLGALVNFEPFPETPEGNQIKVRKGWLSKSLPNNRAVYKAEQTTVAFSAVSTTNRVRWDLVYLDDAGTVFVTAGTEQTTPVADFTGAPDIPRNTAFPIAYVKVTETASVAVSAADIEDIRPAFHFFEQTPVGSIQQSFSSSPPTGWLDMNGQTIGKSGSGASQTGEIYRSLFNIMKAVAPNLGTESFDAGNTVVLKNLAGRFLVTVDGADTDWDVIGDTGGTKTISTAHSHNAATDIAMAASADHQHTIGAHTHPIANYDHTHTGTAGAPVPSGSNTLANGANQSYQHSHNVVISTDSHDHGAATGSSSGNTGAAGAHVHSLSGTLSAGSASVATSPKFCAVKTFVKY